MKISKDSEWYKTIKAGVEAIQEDHTLENTSFMRIQCFHTLILDLRNKEHPVHKVRKRYMPYDPDFKTYPEGCHDSHINTAMKAIFADLGVGP